MRVSIGSWIDCGVFDLHLQFFRSYPAVDVLFPIWDDYPFRLQR